MSILDPPDTQYTPAEIVSIGREAKELLESPVMRMSWDECERQLLMKCVTGVSVEAREDARRSLGMIATVQQALQGMVDIGLLEAHNAEKAER